jgi:hypothetical protein
MDYTKRVPRGPLVTGVETPEFVARVGKLLLVEACRRRRP